MKHADTLHLVLKGKWYDMIESGEKTEEYRETKDYWIKRIIETKHERVCFHRGYTNRTMIFEIKDVWVYIGKAAWGAPVDKIVIIIKLGKRLPCKTKQAE